MMQNFGMLADATDLIGVISAIGGYQTAAMAIGIAVFLYVIGRKIVRRIV